MSADAEWVRACAPQPRLDARTTFNTIFYILFDCAMRVLAPFSLALRAWDLSSQQGRLAPSGRTSEVALGRCPTVWMPGVFQEPLPLPAGQ